jgi:hypothetical protein
MSTLGRQNARERDRIVAMVSGGGYAAQLQRRIDAIQRESADLKRRTAETIAATAAAKAQHDAMLQTRRDSLLAQSGLGRAVLNGRQSKG